MKKVIAFVLCLAIITGSAVSAFAAETVSGTTLRLSKTEGTVSVKKSSGKTVKIKSDMQLKSGYTVKTANKSYAFISLDGSKAVKMDANSEVQILKSGKKLEVVILAGKIYFDVSEKLNSDESLNIRTSTMVTGIHGTGGTGTVNSFTLDSGEIEIKYTDESTGETFSYTINPGQKIQVPSSTSTKKVSNQSEEQLKEAIEKGGQSEETKQILSERLKNMVQTGESANQTSMDGNVNGVVITNLASPLTERDAFSLSYLAENPQSLQRAVEESGDSSYGKELATLTPQIAEEIKKADEIIESKFVPATSETYADGTENDQKEEKAPDQEVHIGREVNIDEVVKKAEEKQAGSGETTQNAITVVTPPKQEEQKSNDTPSYNPPAPTPAQTYSLSLPNHIYGKIHDTDAKQTTLVAFALVSGSLSNIQSGTDVIFELDFNDAAFEKNKSMYSVSLFDSRNINAEMTWFATGPSINGFTPKYYKLSGITTNVAITVKLEATQYAESLDFVSSLFTNDSVTEIEVFNVGTLSGVTIPENKTLIFHNQVTFDGTVENKGELVLESNTTFNGMFVNSNTMTVSGDAIILGTLTNGGIISAPNGGSFTFTNMSDHTFINEGTITIGAKSCFYNGDSDTTGARVINNAAGVINFVGSDAAENYGQFTNYGTINIDNAAFMNYGTITDDGNIAINNCAKTDTGFFAHAEKVQGGPIGEYSGRYTLAIYDPYDELYISRDIWSNYTPSEDKEFMDWYNELYSMDYPIEIYHWWIDKDESKLFNLSEQINGDITIALEKYASSVYLPKDVAATLSKCDTNPITMAAFRVASGSSLDGVSKGGSVVIAVDWIKTASYDEFYKDAYAIEPIVYGATIRPTSAPLDDNPISSDYSPTYYEITDIQEDTTVTFVFHLNNWEAEIGVIPSILSNELCEGVVVTPAVGGDSIGDIEVAFTQSIEFNRAITLSGECINNGVIKFNGSDSRLSISGDASLENNGQITLNGAPLDNNGAIDNSGALYFIENAGLDNYGILTNAGVIYIEDSVVRNNGTINDSGEIYISKSNADDKTCGFYYIVGISGDCSGEYNGKYSLSVTYIGNDSEPVILGSVPSSVWEGYNPCDDVVCGDWTSKYPTTRYTWTSSDGQAFDPDQRITTDTDITITERNSFSIILPNDIVENDITLASFKIISDQTLVQDGNKWSGIKDDSTITILMETNVASVGACTFTLYLAGGSSDGDVLSSGSGDTGFASYQISNVSEDMEVVLAVDINKSSDNEALLAIIRDSGNMPAIGIKCPCTLSGIEIKDGQYVAIFSDVYIDGNVRNNGSIHVCDSGDFKGSLTVYGQLLNDEDGEIINDGSVKVAAGGSLTNIGCFIHNEDAQLINEGNQDSITGSGFNIYTQGYFDSTILNNESLLFSEEVNNDHVMYLQFGTNELSARDGVDKQISVSAVVVHGDDTETTIPVEFKDEKWIVNVPYLNTGETIKRIKMIAEEEGVQRSSN